MNDDEKFNLLAKENEKRLKETQNQDKKEEEIEPGTPQNKETYQDLVSWEESETSDLESEKDFCATEDLIEEKELTPTIIPTKNWKRPDYRPRGGVKSYVATPTLSQTIQQSESKPPTGFGLLLLLGVFASVLQKFLEAYRKRKKKFASYCIITNFMHHDLKLGAYLVFTDKAPQFKKDLKLEVLLEKFMIGEIIGILEEDQRLILIEVFPHKKFKFKSKINFGTPYIYLDDLKESTFFKFALLFTKFVKFLQ